jgi:phosphonoacetaldehyde hydrolase
MHLKAIIFDWAGTAVDFGSLCPVASFQSAFTAKGVDVPAADIHRFMGIRKWEHIQAVLQLPEISAKWETAQGRQPARADVDDLYQKAEALLLDSVADFATPTPGLPEALAAARRRGLKIGSTTGYTAPLMAKLAPAAKAQGFDPDHWVASDQVPQGRPWPWMIFKNLERLEICPPSAVVKIGDTIADIAEAINAGAWGVGVVESSSLTGKSPAEFAAMPAEERRLLLEKTREQLMEAGADLVINNLTGLDEALEQIGARLEAGNYPGNFAAPNHHLSR